MSIPATRCGFSRERRFVWADVARVLGPLLLVIAVVVAAPDARADARDLSREAFLQGVAQAHQGDYVAARNSFLKAYGLFAHPSILLNLGIARWHTGEYVAAEQDLARFLSDDGGASPEEIADARAALAASRTHLGTVRLKIEPEGARALIDGQPVALVPHAFAQVRALLGPHKLRAEAEGYETLDQSLNIQQARSSDVEITLAPFAHDTTTVTPPGEVPLPPPRSKRRQWVGWSLVGFGGLAAGLGAFFGVEAITHASAYNSPGSSSYQNAKTRSTGILFRTTADIAFATSIVSAGSGLYLLIAPASYWPGQLGARLVISPSFAGVSGDF